MKIATESPDQLTDQDLEQVMTYGKERIKE